MISNTEYFSHLYEIASSLNKEFSLHAALRKSLEKTVQLLELETGWIWLMQDDKSVYLAASYNLPPALSNYPERLSGKCYCIEKYLSNHINTAKNISEVVCTRLKNLKSGTMDLKFHATIPIKMSDKKVGLINLVSKESQQLNENQLCVLNTIGELIGMAIQRTRVQDAYGEHSVKTEIAMVEVLKRVFTPKIDTIISGLESASSISKKTDIPGMTENINLSLNQARQLGEHFSLIVKESSGNYPLEKKSQAHFQYPSSPLTNRELELLGLVKKGLTNKQIAESFFITERTVKFHITSILSKLSASTRTEAVDVALKRGIIGTS